MKCNYCSDNLGSSRLTAATEGAAGVHHACRVHDRGVPALSFADTMEHRRGLRANRGRGILRFPLLAAEPPSVPKCERRGSSSDESAWNFL